MDNVEVQIWQRHIKIGKRGNPPYIKDELYSVVDEDSSSWQFIFGELQISLHKRDPAEWPSVLMPHLARQDLDTLEEESRSAHSFNSGVTSTRDSRTSRVSGMRYSDLAIPEDY
jgi:hypothetical protein